MGKKKRGGGVKISIMISIFIFLSYIVVLFENLAHKLVFRMVNRLDDESIVPRVVKEAATFARRAKFR